jgi:hypothetical protein
LGIDFYIECRGELALYWSDPVYTTIHVMADSKKKSQGSAQIRVRSKTNRKPAATNRIKRRTPGHWTKRAGRKIVAANIVVKNSEYV